MPTLEIKPDSVSNAEVTCRSVECGDDGQLTDTEPTLPTRLSMSLAITQPEVCEVRTLLFRINSRMASRHVRNCGLAVCLEGHRP